MEFGPMVLKHRPTDVVVELTEGTVEVRYKI